MIRDTYRRVTHKILYVSLPPVQHRHMTRTMTAPYVVAATAAVLLAACATTSTGPEETRMRQDAHKRTVIERYFEEVWNQGQLDVLDELLAPDYVNHSSSMPDAPPGPEGVKPIVAAMRRAFPDLHYTIDRMVVGDDAVAVRVTLTGTHVGDFFGIPPTGKPFKVTQTNIEQFRDGKIVAHWRNTDELSLLRQLGVVP